MKKLQHLKKRLKDWNKQVFKNIFKEKIRIEQDTEALDNKVIKNGMFRNDFEKEKWLKNEHKDVLAIEELYWRDKSREAWLRSGDHNSNFFHISTKT